MGTRTFGEYTFETSNEDKVFFPDAGVTKGDLIEYYERIADVMLPHVRGRPVVMQRFPDGIDQEGFYQKDAPDYFPDWIERASLPKEGGTVKYVVCQRTADLVYLANQGCVTPHTFLSHADAPNQPDRLIIDLDPSGDDFAAVRWAARRVRDSLAECGLLPFLMATGGRGLHVVVPLQTGPDFDRVRAFAQHISARLAATYGDRLTVEQRKDKRAGRVFLDVNRDAYGQTAVTPYAVRARPGAPVAVPLEWEELDDGELRPNQYTVRNVFRRLGQKSDVWSTMQRHARTLPEKDTWPERSDA